MQIVQAQFMPVQTNFYPPKDGWTGGWIRACFKVTTQRRSQP